MKSIMVNKRKKKISSDLPVQAVFFQKNCGAPVPRGEITTAAAAAAVKNDVSPD